MIKYTFDDALYLMDRLRDPKDGCPWDIKQTYADIIPYTLEECYELADAIAHGDMPHTEEELGDVLFQVLFFAKLGKEDGHFDFNSIVHNLVTKLVRRHPHVFPHQDLRARHGTQPKETPAIKAAWENIKAQERQQKQKIRLLDDVPLALPALSRAQKLQKRAASVGMEWPALTPVIDKLYEEISELKAALANNDEQNIKEEAGDILFSVVNVIRHLSLDAEDVLRSANDKFKCRIDAMEENTQANGQKLAELSASELELLWQQVKNAN